MREQGEGVGGVVTGRPTKRTDATRATTRKIGRPTKRTQATMQVIVEAILDGATFALAASAGRISYETFNEWRKTFPDFSEMVDSAVAESARWHLQNIKNHASEDWRASGWMLEHRFPQEYGRSVQEQQHSGQVKHTVTVQYVNDWRGVSYQTPDVADVAALAETMVDGEEAEEEL